jgi:hypothetical protein
MSTSEVSFEQRFGQLVDAELNEKLPTLIDNRIGFQVIDKTDDDSKAVGVYAFLLNNVWIYLPVFFIDGKIEGFELLYLKQKDIFVPAMDNWVAALNEKGIQVLGDTITEQDENADGQTATPGNTSTAASNGSISKIASDNSAPFASLQKIAHNLDVNDANSHLEKEAVLEMFRPYATDTSVAYPSLSRDLPKLHKSARQRFVNTMVGSPDFANALFSCYAVDDIEKLARECMEDNITPRKEAGLTYITNMRSKEAAELSNSEKRLLVKNNIFVKDHRTNFSKVYHEEVDTSVLQNVSCPGVYDVLMQDGSFEKRIVLVPRVIDNLNSPARAGRYEKTQAGVDIAVINPSKAKGFERRCSRDIYGKPATECKPSELYDQQGGLKATVRSLRDVPEGAHLLFVNGPKECLMTQLKERRQDASGNIVVTLTGESPFMAQEPSLNSYPSELTVHFVKGGKLCIKGDMVFVPEESRVFVDYPEWMVHCEGTKKGPNGGEIAKVTYGTPNVIRDLAYGDSQMGRVELTTSGERVSVKDANGHTDMLSKKATLKVLCEKHGIHAPQAMQLLKSASKAPGGRRAWLVKYAAPYDTEAYKGSKMPYMGGPSGTDDSDTLRFEEKAQEGAPLTVASDASGASILPEQAISQAQKASQAGIKEVLDVEVLKQLLDKADISELRKDYITEMIQGMDRIGRMLFIYYWHHDEFEAKYGKDQIQELKEKMIQVFNSTGDLILFLKEKTAFNPDQSESLFGSLSEDVATAG